MAHLGYCACERGAVPWAQLGRGQHPWVRQDPPPRQGSRCGGWPSAWHMCTEAALARHPRARLQWQQNLQGTAWASAAGFGGGTRVSSPSLLSTFNDLPPGLLRTKRHPSQVWEAESERCVLPLIAQLLFLLLTGLLTYCEYRERGTYRVVRCWKHCLTV